MSQVLSIVFGHSLTGRFLHLRWLQAFGLIVFWIIMDTGFRKIHSPIPGSIGGLLLLWLLLEIRLIRPTWIEQGADGLLNHLMLFFVPAMLALLNHHELLGVLGFQLLLAVLGGTLIVMAGTALVVEIGFRFIRRHHEKSA